MSGWCLTWCLVQCDLPCNLDGVPGVVHRLTGLSFCKQSAGYHSGITPGLSFNFDDCGKCGSNSLLRWFSLKTPGWHFVTAEICRSRVACSTLGSNALKSYLSAQRAAHGTSDTDCHPSLMSRLHCSKSSLGNFGASMSTFIFHFTFHTEEAERSQLFLFSISYIAS